MSRDETKGEGYYANPYEIEAYYFQFLYDQGYIDIYGNIKKGVEENHEKWSKQFYEEGYVSKTTGKEIGPYRSWDGVQERYGNHWTWKRDWSFNETY